MGTIWRRLSSVDDGFTPSVGGGPDLSFVLLGSTAVPEPSTWAMLIVGFGGIGLMIRRAPAIARQAA